MSDESNDSVPLWKRARVSVRKRTFVTVGIVFALAIAALAMGLPVVLSPPRTVNISPRSTNTASNDGLAHVSSAGIGSPSLIVHVVGAVARPGLVSLRVGSRVIDAVFRAGGLLTTADQCGVNLARALTDGEQVVIPLKHGGATSCTNMVATSQGTNAAGSGTKLSLSRASLAELDSLPGVGPALAQRIIDWRSSHGGFQSVNQLDSVSGIGQKLMSSLKPLVVP